MQNIKHQGGNKENTSILNTNLQNPKLEPAYHRVHTGTLIQQTGTSLKVLRGLTSENFSDCVLISSLICKYMTDHMLDMLDPSADHSGRSR